MDKLTITPEIISTQVPYQGDPTILFQQLCDQRSATLLLESAEITSKQNIKSLMLVDSCLRITAKQQLVTIEALSINGAYLLPNLAKHFPNNVAVNYSPLMLELTFPAIDFNQQCDEAQRLQSQSVFDSLRAVFSIITAPDKMAECVMIGGLFTYDLIEQFEPIPVLPARNSCPDFCFYLPEILLLINHTEQTAHLHSVIYTIDDAEQNRVFSRLENIHAQMYQIMQPIAHQPIADSKLNCNQTDDYYASIVTKLQENIRAGDVFQIVPSRIFSLPCAKPLAAYHQLKLTNPSPYMFFMQDKDFCLFGASPESALKFDSKTRQVEIYPMAGTRHRGKHPDGSIDLDLDCRLELDMRLNHKEMAEHIMLVDLARNDLARICVPGSRYVAELTKVDRYSHVMHLISRVVGRLRPELDALHAYRATMNMGTLTGAPKVRAMQLIAESEQQRRGSYAGAVGYLNAAGDLDTCIVIRSAYVQDGIAYVQAGAGVVLDSDPHAEAAETKQKAQAAISAIMHANMAKE